jgi:hypothetical protein
VSPAATAQAEARAAARWLNSYARRYHAGAFATPTAKDMQALIAQGRWRYKPAQGVGLIEQQPLRAVHRTDWTGRRYELAAGDRIANHLSADPGATLPNLHAYDWVYSHIEDPGVTGQLRAQGRELAAVRISASSELIGCWGRPGTGHAYSAADKATLVRLDLVNLRLDDVAAEVRALGGWLDDFPFYSNGAWSALNLRGFKPGDPGWGIKPAEMSRKWHAEHPEAAAMTECKWTVLAERCPQTVDLVRQLEHADWMGWGGGLERVRFLRMAPTGSGTKSSKPGTLARHTDITDKAAGTADGLITRFHFPVITWPGVTMSAWNLRGEKTAAHLPQGTGWYLDARKPHAVDNASGKTRIHLVIDVLTTAATRDAITRNGTDMAA